MRQVNKDIYVSFGFPYASIKNGPITIAECRYYDIPGIAQDRCFPLVQLVF